MPDSRIAELGIERRGFAGEQRDCLRVELIWPCHYQIGKLEFAAGLDPRVKVPKSLATKQCQYDAVLLGPDNDSWTIRKKQQICPFDRLVKCSARMNGNAQHFDAGPLPTGKRPDIGIGVSSNGAFHHGNGYSPPDRERSISAGYRELNSLGQRRFGLARREMRNSVNRALAIMSRTFQRIVDGTMLTKQRRRIGQIFG